MSLGDEEDINVMCKKKHLKFASMLLLLSVTSNCCEIGVPG
jgi:hypothetical protein